MSFLSVLEKIGQEALKILTIGERVAVIASPLIDAYAPGISGLFNGVLTDTLTAQQLALQSAQAAAPGPERQKAVIDSLQKSLPMFEQTTGLKLVSGKEQAFAQAVYDISLMFQTSTPAPATPTPASAG